MVIGKMNRRIKVQKWGSGAVDAYGSPTVAVTEEWTKWAAVEDKRGAASTFAAMQGWNYDYKITIRYEISRPTQSNYILVYESQPLRINSVQVVGEGDKRFEVLRCSKLEGQIASGGGGGGGGIITMNYLDGVPSTATDKFITLTIEFPQANGTFNIFCDKSFRVDWGDGIIRLYPDNCLVNWGGLASSGITYFKLYHEDNVTNMIIGPISHLYARSAIGGYPVTLTKLNMTGCRLLEAFTLPPLIVDLNIQVNALPTSEMDAFTAQLNANGLSNGKLEARFQSPSALFTNNADLNDLVDKNWQVLEGDV